MTSEYFPQIKIIFGGKHKHRPEEIVDVEEFIAIKSYKAKGKRLTTFEVSKIIEIEPLQKILPETEPEKIEIEKEDLSETKNKKVLKNNKNDYAIQTTLF